MNLRSIGHFIAERRRAKQLTVRALAEKAGVGRSTLAALEAGKLAELGYSKIERLCRSLDLVLEARPTLLDAPLMPHRHLTEVAGRELTKAAIEDILTQGDFQAWRGLVRAMHADKTGQIARRVQEIATLAGKSDSRIRAFSSLLPEIRSRHR
ncbi:MAG TPA: helix-turn-helix transcriptional regulator [Gammaproteobacteria bacterium]|nr:helix-turn-helix transcriptional regulator [Gammaproteobacteria bacterium]